MRYVSPELSARRAEAGRKGGIITFQKRGAEGMGDIGREGGRPRRQTIEELMTLSRDCSIKSKRRMAPVINANPKLSTMFRSLAGIKKEGEPAGYQTVGSPEGARE